MALVTLATYIGLVLLQTLKFTLHFYYDLFDSAILCWFCMSEMQIHQLLPDLKLHLLQDALQPETKKVMFMNI